MKWASGFIERQKEIRINRLRNLRVCRDSEPSALAALSRNADQRNHQRDMMSIAAFRTEPVKSMKEQYERYL